MYTLKSIVRKGTLFGASAALLASVVAPTVGVFANSLNPLTQRSLLLSSSAPGYQDTDGAGNSASNPNAWNGGEYYALPGSGPNGKKTGQTFSFNVSTDSVADDRPIQSFTLQYCTSAAGLCQAPGDNLGDAREGEKDDTPYTGAGPHEDGRETNAVAHPESRSDLDVNYGASSVHGTDFEVRLNGNPVAGVDWDITATNEEDDEFIANNGNDGHLTGKRNYVTISTDSEDFAPEFNDRVQIVFTASDDHYITNPGSNEFFVKINTYDSETVQNDTTRIDGGVTVANVMTESVHITTKVLETMSFSVGIRNPDTLAQPHGSCDIMETVNGANHLELGDANAEFSLKTSQAYDQHSYWRLSSNSSGGAVVYYSGDTLRNTVGDEIRDMATMAHSQPGTEQFGLALVAANDPLDDSVWAADTPGYDPEDHTIGDPRFPFPENHPSNWAVQEARIYPLVPGAAYNNNPDGDGTISNTDDTTQNAQFTFRQSSKAVPEVLASNALAVGGSGGVISCATAKVRYVANIAADTPAGVYTTKINYLAAPQY